MQDVPSLRVAEPTKSEINGSPGIGLGLVASNPDWGVERSLTGGFRSLVLLEWSLSLWCPTARKQRHKEASPREICKQDTIAWESCLLAV